MVPLPAGAHEQSSTVFLIVRFALMASGGAFPVPLRVIVQLKRWTNLAQNEGCAVKDRRGHSDLPSDIGTIPA
jgi:hypothetical protein